MTESCIIRNANGQIRCIYCIDNNLYIKNYGAYGWERRILVSDKVKNGFTAAISDISDICVIYTQTDLSVCTACESGGWQGRELLHANSDEDIIIHCIINKSGTKLLYNRCAAASRITMRYRPASGVWSGSADVDAFVPFGGRTFRLIAADECILLYLRRAPEIQLGYRLINNERISAYKQVYASGYNITDYSVFYYDNTLCAAVVVNMGFSCRLIFGCGLKSTVVAEGRGIYSCIAAMTGGNIYIWWISGGRLYGSISYDGGATFTRAEAYRGDFCTGAAKAQFIDFARNDTYVTDLYVNKNSPWEIQLSDWLGDDFFACANSADESLRAENESLRRRVEEYSVRLKERDELINRLNNSRA